MTILGESYADLVFDNVGGEGFPVWPKVLKVGGKYVTSVCVVGYEGFIPKRYSDNWMHSMGWKSYA